MVSHTSVFPYARRFVLPHFIRLVSNYHSPLSLSPVTTFPSSSLIHEQRDLLGMLVLFL
jgi:hypothetical protein